MQVDFHTHIPNTLDYACRLTRKIITAGQQLAIIAPSPLLRAIDEQLWTFSALDFIPHCPFDHTLAPETPVLLAPHFTDTLQRHLLLNLGNMVLPPDTACVTRLLEVVSNQPDELAAARARYRVYLDRHYTLKSYKSISDPQ